MTERILIAEDDPAIADSVGYSLRACGYHVDVVGSGEAVLESGPGSYDLLILDVMLPGLSGVEVCRRVRDRSAVPVLMLTALAGEADRVVGLEAGADDYLGKPFSMAEMVSRVRAILRRRRLDREPDAVRQVGGLYLDLAAQAARIGGGTIELTRRSSGCWPCWRPILGGCSPSGRSRGGLPAVPRLLMSGSAMCT
jgi:DNA-binding response OmpR family regulator